MYGYSILVVGRGAKKIGICCCWEFFGVMWECCWRAGRMELQFGRPHL